VIPCNAFIRLVEGLVKQRTNVLVFAKHLTRLTASVLIVAMTAAAQSNGDGAAMSDAIRELQEQVRELRSAVTELRAEATQYRTETETLRRELQAQKTQATAEMPSPQSGVTSNSPTAEMEDSIQLLNSKINDQYQTKIESASKYHMRLSGIVLLNLFHNTGAFNSADIPTWVLPPGNSSPHSFGATLRQSQIGLEAFGPSIGGAKTSAEVTLDFGAGFQESNDGVNHGLVRLRTASMHMDWKNTSIVAGQDNLFFSPESPTSFASLAIPSFAYAGNLWGWTPQLRVEHRTNLSEGQSLTFQAGILDNLTGEPPVLSYIRVPQAGERSGQPAYATRVAWASNLFGKPLTFGAAGYYSRQDWGFGNNVDGWAGMSDWDVPLPARLSLSGEIYRGRAIGGLGGGIARSVIFNGNPGPGVALRPLNTVGGWSQLKFRANSRLEFNGAFGLDTAYAADVRAFLGGQSYFASLLTQNRGTLVNFIYRPRSSLLFSGEYRHLRTFEIDSTSPTANQVNVTMGVLF